MTKNDYENQFVKLVRGLKFSTVTIVKMINDSEARIELKTKCQNFYFDEFEETIFDLANAVGDEYCSLLYSKFFDKDNYLGTISRIKQDVDKTSFENFNIVGETIDQTIKESEFIQTIKLALKSRINDNRLRWKGSARQLGYIISVLSDYDLIDVPKSSDKINASEFAKQILASFDIKCDLQAMRKSVDPDQNQLTRKEKVYFSDELNRVIKAINSKENL